MGLHWIADTSDLSGINLLNNNSGTASADLQIGSGANESIKISMPGMTDAGPGLAATSFDLSTAGNASGALAMIDVAIDSVTTARGGLGATQNRLQSSNRST
jgi:flagellin